jgi:hypothetical protein
VRVSRDEPSEEARDLTLWSESSPDVGDRTRGDVLTFMLEMSGASYTRVFVVEIRATGSEILLRSICSERFLTVWLLLGDDICSVDSVRLMRLVMARASDMMAD